MTHKGLFTATWRSLLISLMLLMIANSSSGETVSIFYALTVPQLEFAAGDIKTALEARGFAVEFRDIVALSDTFEGKKVVLAMASNTAVSTLMVTQGGTAFTRSWGTGLCPAHHIFP